MVVPQLKGSHIEMVSLKFNTQSFATDVKIDIEDRLSQVNRRDEFSRMMYDGPDVEITDLHHTSFEKTYLISFEQTIHEVNCTNYPTKRFQSYEDCDDFYIKKKMAKTGFPINSDIDHDGRKMETKDKEATVALENYIRGRIFNDCPKPCSRTNVKITTHYFPPFNFLTVMTSLGSSMGLWLGLSVLQLLFVLTRLRRNR